MADNINKEVECTMSLERNISVPIPVVRRPSAPAPPIINEIDDGFMCGNEGLHLYLINSHTFYND
jgi:hypothetical protein